MNLRAIIFDVYGTLLEVGAPPPDADMQWKQLFSDLLGTTPTLSRQEFAKNCAQAVTQRHMQARARGIAYPEICWPTIVTEVLPAVAGLPNPKQSEFLLRQVATDRSLRLADHAAGCLRQLKGKNLALGIASNAQAYTLTELDRALKSEGLDLSLFDTELRVWSFENGFSKPDPHVFQILTARLEARGIQPSEIVMVGDRLDNDVAPARAYGWQTWQLALHRQQASETSGNWQDLSKWLASRPS